MEDACIFTQAPSFLSKEVVYTNNTLYGKCILSIKFNNEQEYKKWANCLGNRKWEFLTTFPAIMRAEYRFQSVDDVDVMVRKIVQLLQLGFDVHSASWQLEQYESMLK